MVYLSALSFATVALATAAELGSAHVVQKRDPVPTKASLYARQAVTTGAFSDFSGTLPASVSSIIATITSGTASVVPTYSVKSTYTAGAINPSISNAPPLPNREWQRGIRCVLALVLTGICPFSFSSLCSLICSSRQLSYSGCDTRPQLWNWSSDSCLGRPVECSRHPRHRWYLRWKSFKCSQCSSQPLGK
jgi:hypothetical protein